MKAKLQQALIEGSLLIAMAIGVTFYYTGEVWRRVRR